MSPYIIPAITGGISLIGDLIKSKGDKKERERIFLMNALNQKYADAAGFSHSPEAMPGKPQSAGTSVLGGLGQGFAAYQEGEKTREQKLKDQKASQAKLILDVLGKQGLSDQNKATTNEALSKLISGGM